MTPYLKKLHEQRKERLERIKKAAFREAPLADKPVVPEPEPVPTPIIKPKRRPEIVVVREDEGAVIGEVVIKLSLREITRLVAKYFDIPVALIRSDQRSAPIVWARHIYCYIARQHLHASTPRIGRAIGRDHTTVLHAIRRVSTFIAEGNEQVIFDIERINTMIEEKLDCHSWTHSSSSASSASAFSQSPLPILSSENDKGPTN